MVETTESREAKWPHEPHVSPGAFGFPDLTICVTCHNRWPCESERFLASLRSTSRDSEVYDCTNGCHDDHCVKTHGHEPPHSDSVHEWGDDNACPPTSRDSEVREAAWLIERGQSIGHVPTVWWGWDRATGVSRWTEDASEAFRFPSRAAAEIEIERRSGLPIPSHGGPFGVATTHVFLEPLAPPSRDSEVRAIEAIFPALDRRGDHHFPQCSTIRYSGSTGPDIEPPDPCTCGGPDVFAILDRSSEAVASSGGPAIDASTSS